MQFEPTEQYLKEQGLSLTLPERFWKRVNKYGPVPEHVPHLGPCWVWTGAAGRDNRGVIYNLGKNIYAARACWILTVGPIPPEHHVLHKCDYPPCINPRHLFTGTSKDNSQDMVKKNRHLKMIQAVKESNRRRSGELCAASILTWKIVAKIRSMGATGMSGLKIASVLGISKSTAYNVLSGRFWPEHKNPYSQA